MKKEKITIEVTINASISTVWDKWTTPNDIICWNFASDDWSSPRAENDLRVGGRFNFRMEAKDGNFGFDFWGDYTNIEFYKCIESVLGDGRKLKVEFLNNNNKTIVKESFETEDENSVELQRSGWLAILNNFKKHVEKN